MLACGIDRCYIVTSEKASCLVTVAAVCNVSGLASINGKVTKHVYTYSEMSMHYYASC